MTKATHHGSHAVLAWADVIAERAGDTLADRGHLAHPEALGAEQTIDGISAERGKEFAARVGPLILFGAGHVRWARGNQGNVTMGTLASSWLTWAEV